MLIVRVGAMGDVLHALFAVSALRQARPELAIDWIVDERWSPLLASSGNTAVVDRVFGVPIATWKRAPLSRATWLSLRGLWTLRAHGYDPVVDLQGTLRSAGIARLAGVGVRWGWRDPRERPARSLYDRRAERRGAHIVEQMTALLGDACGLSLLPATMTELPRNTGAEAWAEAVAHDADGPVALLAPTAGWGAKQWPAERFGELASQLAAQGFAVIVNASHAKDPVVLKVMQASQGTARAIVCGVAELIALTRRAALVVGGDSGPVHLAAALRVPSVALFGPTDPARNGPWGAGPKRVLRDPSSVTSYRHVGAVEAGLARLSVEAVLAAALAVTDRHL